MNEQTSAAAVARAEMTAAQDGRRDDWLAYFAIDARVEDPVGHAALGA